ncbi:hypothetical protein [Flavobacterium psychrophilum]|uniref:Uncharacterized protein n=1 Tax=Flavobacterium psychrophilum TaxID=96345 RepID=A0A7U2NFD1_FLAPS|nr:hypothetical protein [Flavobacterium psychrophilum]EKT3958569.1 hypothetical protein [Flavobacterium psychrophilum]EKT4510776.1 hypothetical protein [Flavobacterium psychrophilum]MEB3380596.1 hypothetical protein [Flavobacterium psychrophilum]QRE04057.1 hypothetical protein H0H26_00125 [Flavobacterium psychrophilum]
MDYIILIGLIVFLCVYYWIDRKNLEDFFYKEPYEKFNALRLYFILIVGIIGMIAQILKQKT